jgi:hypothetical protein
MPIDELLRLLDDLRRADIRLATTKVGTPERRAAWREVRRLERDAFAGVLRPEADTRNRRPPAGLVV